MGRYQIPPIFWKGRTLSARKVTARARYDDRGLNFC